MFFGLDELVVCKCLYMVRFKMFCFVVKFYDVFVFCLYDVVGNIVEFVVNVCEYCFC